MMHRFMLACFALTFLAAPLVPAGCSKPSAVVKHDNRTTMVHVLGESDNNRTVDIRVGESIRITLPENATTGYRWEIEQFNRELIGMVAEEPKYNGHALGSGGHIEFVFQGRKPGATELVLKEWRSWEGDASVIARYHLRVNVLP
ncbi:MAG: protease inhibitor I42 family protein [Chlorobiaceae bacterium]|nr:protease inhibitor I42 family protein [Chlorobiaceae bacterium]